MATIIGGLAVERGRLASLGRQARETVARNHGLDDYAARLLDLACMTWSDEDRAWPEGRPRLILRYARSLNDGVLSWRLTKKLLRAAASTRLFGGRSW
jgi:hypothetical protein